MLKTRDDRESKSGAGRCSTAAGQTSAPSDSSAALFGLDNKGGWLSFFNGDCRIRVANSFELRESAYRFIYGIYRGLGYTSEGMKSRWLTIYDALPETTTLIAENRDGDISGAITLVFDSPIGLPGDSMFKVDLDRLRGEGARLCESMSFATAENTRGSVKTIAALFYCGYLLAWRARNATHWTTNVIETHERFYCRNLFFERFGPMKNCNRAQGLPVVLLVLSFQVANRMRSERRIFPISLLDYSDVQEAEISRHLDRWVTPMSQDEFSEFFLNDSVVYESASSDQNKILKSLYTF